MTPIVHKFKTSYVATATALFLNFPPVGEIHAATLVPAYDHEFEPLVDDGKRVSDALALSAYSHEAVFSLLTEVAIRLIETSKPLDRDFAKVVEKEFWNLLQ